MYLIILTFFFHFQAPICNLNLCLQPDITPETTGMPEGWVANCQTKYTDIVLEIGHSPSGILAVSGVMSSCRHRFKLQLGAWKAKFRFYVFWLSNFFLQQFDNKNQVNQMTISGLILEIIYIFMFSCINCNYFDIFFIFRLPFAIWTCACSLT